MKIYAIADIHFGKLDNDEEVYNALHKHFIERSFKEKPDLIVICGDSYDSRVLINSTANIYFNKFIDDCISTGATIIVIEGTESHERYQINALLHYSSDKFFIVNTVRELNILGLKLLILPEEYVKSDEYYKEFMNKKYDFVFGHGMASHVGFSSIASEEIVRHPFIWEAKELEKIVKYYIVFGHIHTHSEFHNFIYCGSFSRLNFGEMESKGFITITLNKDKVSYEFIENTDAPTFSDIYESKLPSDVDSLLKQLRGYQEHNDYLRIVIDQDDDNKFNTIKGFVQNHKNCCIKRVAKSSEVKMQEIANNIKEKQNVLNEKMNEFKGLSLIEITQKIAKRDYREEFSQEEINYILNTTI